MFMLNTQLANLCINNRKLCKLIMEILIMHPIIKFHAKWFLLLLTTTNRK